MKKVGVILCGCGRFDGSEIHESVLTLLHLSRLGAQAVCYAPQGPQWATCEHFEGQPSDPPRDMLTESARIARGEVQPLAEARVDDLDALILPGGAGAAHNLCSFAEQGAEGTVHPELQPLLDAFRAATKPIGAICIAPAILALAFRDPNLSLTLGPPEQPPASVAAATGVRFVDCAVDGIVIDDLQNIVSTPAYILGPDIAAIDRGIGRLVVEVLRRTRTRG